MGEGAAVVDAGLVARARGGDSEAFGQLVSRHERAMLSIARAYLASEVDAEDAVQQAFLKAYEALDGLADGRRFAAWLKTITANVCRDTLREQPYKASLADYSSSAQFRPRLGEAPPTPATLCSKGEQVELLKIAVGRLPEAQRVVVMLRYKEHMSYKHISAYLDLEPSTIRGRLQGAKRALRKALKPLVAEEH
jgi:RNA polymerase sigma-70 factor (ECF subfamily)